MTSPHVLIFDADGTLRRTLLADRPCPRGPGEWELLPDVAPALRRLSFGPGLRLGVASNQDQVGHGLIDEAVARELVRAAVEAALGEVPAGSALHICPHTPSAGCECRKPRPGMLTTILEETGAAPGAALFVGDAVTDREAAAAAGVAFAWRHDFFPALVAGADWRMFLDRIWPGQRSPG